MRRTAVALATLTAVAALSAPGTAAGEDVEVAGFLCGFSSVADDPTREGHLLAEVDGGPVVVTGTAPGATVELVCTIQVDAWTHAGPDAVSVSASGPGTATVPPTVVSYEMGPDSWEATMCNEVRVSTASGVRALYWDHVEERWSATPDVGCYNPDPEPYPPDRMIDELVCPVLAAGFPPQGDVPGIWDCPPYEY